MVTQTLLTKMSMEPLGGFGTTRIFEVTLDTKAHVEIDVLTMMPIQME